MLPHILVTELKAKQKFLIHANTNEFTISIIMHSIKVRKCQLMPTEACVQPVLRSKRQGPHRSSSLLSLVLQQTTATLVDLVSSSNAV